MTQRPVNNKVIDIYKRITGMRHDTEDDDANNTYDVILNGDNTHEEQMYMFYKMRKTYFDTREPSHAKDVYCENDNDDQEMYTRGREFAEYMRQMNENVEDKLIHILEINENARDNPEYDTRIQFDKDVHERQIIDIASIDDKLYEERQLEFRKKLNELTS